MNIKKGVQFKSVSPQVYYAIGIAEIVYLDRGYRLVVTAGTDGQHKTGSLHYLGLAVDLRTRELSPTDLDYIYHKLNSILDPMGYDVLKEDTHIHIEYDPKTADHNWIEEVS